MRIDRLLPLAALMLAFTTAPACAESGGLDLEKYRGKVVLVDFWASWCAPCKQAFPALARLAHDHRAQDLAVITINEERQRPAGEAFLRQVRSSLPVIWDSAGSIGKSWTVNEMPTTLLFDRKGKLRYRHQGFVAGSAAEYAGQIDALIREH